MRRAKGVVGLGTRRGLIGATGVASGFSIGFGFAFLLGVVLLAIGVPFEAAAMAAAVVGLAAAGYVLWATYGGVKSQQRRPPP